MAQPYVGDLGAAAAGRQAARDSSGAMALVGRHARLAALDPAQEDFSAVDQWLAAMLGDNE